MKKLCVIFAIIFIIANNVLAINKDGDNSNGCSLGLVGTAFFVILVIYIWASLINKPKKDS